MLADGMELESKDNRKRGKRHGINMRGKGCKKNQGIKGAAIASWWVVKLMEQLYGRGLSRKAC